MKYIYVICCLFLGSCVSTRYIDVQVLHPASVKIPFTRNLLIELQDPQNISRQITLQDTTHKAEDYLRVFMQTFDSTLAVTLRESPALNNTDIVTGNENNSKNTVAKNDLMISVDKILMTDTIQPNTDVGYGFYYYSFYDVYYRVQIKVSEVSGNKFFDTRTISDTLSWRGNGNSMEESGRFIPPPIIAVAQAGEMAAKDYAKKLAPYWTKEERILFYNGNKYMREGYKYFLDNQLDNAIKEWKNLYEIGTPQLASIAAHNIAVMYEMLDDVKSSEVWLTNSLKNKWHYPTELYLNRMIQRVSEKPKLDNQMK